MPRNTAKKIAAELVQALEPSPIGLVSPPSPPLTTEEKIALWFEADSQQKFWREKELTLRAELVKECFDAEKKTGTEHYELPNDWKLTVTKSEDYKLDSEGVDAVLEKLPLGLGELLVKWKADLSVSNYKLLSEEQQALFNEILTVKPSSPSLKLVAPKVAK